MYILYFLQILSIHAFKCVLADYCDFGLCEDGVYCCGENKCCKNIDWYYYWAAILLAVISVLIVIYLFFRQRKTNYLYTEVKQEDS